MKKFSLMLNLIFPPHSNLTCTSFSLGCSGPCVTQRCVIVLLDTIADTNTRRAGGSLCGWSLWPTAAPHHKHREDLYTLCEPAGV